jgi:hypothetical protein
MGLTHCDLVTHCDLAGGYGDEKCHEGAHQQNRRYTFDSFVVGSNEFAHATSRAVAEQLSEFTPGLNHREWPRLLTRILQWWN